MRVEKHLSLDEIAVRLALPRTTVYYWLRDLPLGRARRWNTAQRKGTRNMQRKYALRRAAAYLQGRQFWARRLSVSPDDIRLQRKSNSGRLGGRTWRSKHGVLTVSVGDTLLRARLEAWMHSLQDQWLHSPVSGA
jgi:hypothetical protein